VQAVVVAEDQALPRCRLMGQLAGEDLDTGPANAAAHSGQCLAVQFFGEGQVFDGQRLRLSAGNLLGFTRVQPNLREPSPSP
jgi:hypothetical protein